MHVKYWIIKSFYPSGQAKLTMSLLQLLWIAKCFLSTLQTSQGLERNQGHFDIRLTVSLKTQLHHCPRGTGNNNCLFLLFHLEESKPFHPKLQRRNEVMGPQFSEGKKLILVEGWDHDVYYNSDSCLRSAYGIFTAIGVIIPFYVWEIQIVSMTCNEIYCNLHAMGQ